MRDPLRSSPGSRWLVPASALIALCVALPILAVGGRLADPSAADSCAARDTDACADPRHYYRGSYGHAASPAAFCAGSDTNTAAFCDQPDAIL